MTSEDPIRVLANKIFDEHCGYTIFQEDEDDTIAEIAFELENLVDQHSAEARAEQREACARKSKKVIDEYFRTSGHNQMMQGRIENACLNATGESDDT